MNIRVFIIFISFSLFPVLKAATVSGFVKDSLTGEPIAYANVYIEGTTIGTTTSGEGYFVLTDIPGGKYQLTISYMGYAPFKRSINLGINGQISISVMLAASPIKMEEVKVNVRRNAFKRDIQASSTLLNSREINQSPFFLENDLVKVIQSLPGVTGVSDFSSQLYVRGGGSDQNLILLDGVQIFNPIHFGGIFSVFDADAVQKAKLIAGGFPVEYGGRLSSVLDVNTTVGNPNGLQGTASISILSSKLMVDGPLPFLKGSYFISGRRTYFDKILPYFDKKFPYYFYDIYAKVNFEPTDKTRIFISNFLNQDVFDWKNKTDNTFMSWGNRVNSLSIRHLLTPKWFSQTYFTRSYFKQEIILKSQWELTSVLNTIDEISLKSDLTGFISANHEIKAGIEIRRKEWNFDGNFMGGGMSYKYFGIPILSSVYLQDKWSINESWIMQPGIRINYYSVEFDDKIKNHTTITPRLSMKYFLNADLAVKVAVGKYSQFGTNVYLFGEEGFLGSTFYNWYPIWGDYIPSTAIHYIAGLEYWLSESINLSIEGYYKSVRKLYKYDILGVDVNDPLNTFYLAGLGESAGLDFLFKKDLGKYTGWIGYSLGLAVVEFAKDRSYPVYDRRHSLNAIVNIPFIIGFHLSAQFNYGSGTPYSYYLGRYRRYWYDEIDDEYGSRWDDMESVHKRYPPYHRLDILLTKSVHWKRMNFLLKIGAINVYNQKNVFLYYRDHSQNPPPLNEISMLPFFPSIELKVRF